MDDRRWYQTTWESKDRYEDFYHTADNLREATETAKVHASIRGFKGKITTVYFPEYSAMIEDLKRQLSSFTNY